MTDTTIKHGSDRWLAQPYTRNPQYTSPCGRAHQVNAYFDMGQCVECWHPRARHALGQPAHAYRELAHVYRELAHVMSRTILPAFTESDGPR